MNIKKVTCPLCGKHYISKQAIYAHIEKEHAKEIPAGRTADQYYYDITHDGKVSTCTECHRPTPWNPRTHKYARLCGRPACAEKVRAVFHERMMRVYNTDNLATDPEHQRKMLQGRNIHGVYKWSSGGETEYIGTYEEDFLHFCDSVLNLHAEDINGPSPHDYQYEYNGKKHFYIPDFFLPDYGIEVEIKDGGDNPNLHHKIVEVDKIKEVQKDKAMIKQHSYHYIKITNKNYAKFMTMFLKARDGELTRSEIRDKIKVI
jgi:hypothetical protein